LKLLITGGKGFIGRSLAEGLGAGFEIAAPGRAELDLLDERTVAARLAAGRYDAVLHCATYDAAPKTSAKDPARVLEYNLRMFFNLARREGDYGRLIYFGSGAEFGRDNWKPRMAEDCFDEHVPQDQYGLSKYLMTKYALKTANIYNLRLFGVFGPYDDWRYRFLPNICARLALGLPPVIGQNRRADLLYVDDVVAAVRWLLRAEKPRKIYNVCSGAAADYLSLAAAAMRMAGAAGEPRVLRPGEGPEYSGDNSLLLGDSGLRPAPVEQGIKALYDWYKANAQLLDAGQIEACPL
jgi:UDP-glucose 4-epimerase